MQPFRARVEEACACIVQLLAIHGGQYEALPCVGRRVLRIAQQSVLGCRRPCSEGVDERPPAQAAKHNTEGHLVLPKRHLDSFLHCQHPLCGLAALQR